MPALNPAEIAQLRDLVEAALPDVCQVERATSTPDEGGGREAIPAIVATYPCAVLAGTSAREGVRGGRMATSSPYTVTLPYSAEVRAGDVLIVGARRLGVMGTARGGNFATESTASCREEG